jgi:hypothetical protein
MMILAWLLGRCCYWSTWIGCKFLKMGSIASTRMGLGLIRAGNRFSIAHAWAKDMEV